MRSYDFVIMFCVFIPQTAKQVGVLHKLLALLAVATPESWLPVAVAVLASRGLPWPPVASLHVLKGRSQDPRCRLPSLRARCRLPSPEPRSRCQIVAVWGLRSGIIHHHSPPFTTIHHHHHGRPLIPVYLYTYIPI